MEFISLSFNLQDVICRREEDERCLGETRKTRCVCMMVWHLKALGLKGRDKDKLEVDAIFSMKVQESW